MNKIFFILGVKRTGNHAIINWLYKMIPNYVHLNNMRLSDFTVTNYDKYLTVLPVTENYVDNCWTKFNCSNNLIISFENANVQDTTKLINKFCEQIQIKPVIILIYRNPYNALSSIWKIYNKNQQILNKHIKLLIDYGHDFLNNDMQRMNILYDKWFKDITYRKSLSKKLSLQFDDSNFDKIFLHGYSSFDGYLYKNDASKMDVLNRYDNFLNDSVFQDILQKHKTELDAIWNKIKSIYLI